MIFWIWLLSSVMLGAFGQIFMKEAMKSVGPVSFESGATGLAAYFFRAATTPAMAGAVFSYGLSFLLWLMVLSRADLSLARPVMSIGYLITIAYGFYAGESVTLERLLGTVLIVVGIFFVAKSGVKV